MTKDDLGLGVRLTQEAGWNHLESDWLRFFNLGSEGSFVAEFEGRAVGTTMTFISNQVAWVAMVLVEKASRGKGVGTALLKQALDDLEMREIKTVRLDATHLGQPLYEKLGFLPEYEVARFSGIAPQLGGSLKMDVARPSWPCFHGPEARATLRDGGAKAINRGRPMCLPWATTGRLPPLEDIIEFDERMTGTRRAKMLKALFEEFPGNSRVVMKDGDIEGFVTLHPGRSAIQIGPCTATLNAGPALLSDAFGRCAGKAVFVDIPTDHVHAVQIVEKSGLEIQRRFRRMYRGERIRDNIHAIWASSGPEKG